MATQAWFCGAAITCPAPQWATPCGHTHATPSAPHAARLWSTRAMSGSLERAELPSACVGTMFARILLACVPPAELRPTDSYPCGPSISESLPLSDRAEGRRAGRKRQRRGSARLGEVNEALLGAFEAASRRKAKRVTGVRFIGKSEKRESSSRGALSLSLSILIPLRM
jgi:hypothetical protein